MQGTINVKEPTPSQMSRQFRTGFHLDADSELSAGPATPSAEELAMLRDVTAARAPPVLATLETLARRSLLCHSSLEWLLATLQQTLDSEHPDPSLLEALWHFIRTVHSASLEISAGSFACALQHRRTTFLRACDPLRVPVRLRPWLSLSSPFSAEPKPPLFGPSLEECRPVAREDREISLVSSLIAVTKQPGSQYRGTRAGKKRRRRPAAAAPASKQGAPAAGQRSPRKRPFRKGRGRGRPAAASKSAAGQPAKPSE